MESKTSKQAVLRALKNIQLNKLTLPSNILMGGC